MNKQLKLRLTRQAVEVGNYANWLIDLAYKEDVNKYLEIAEQVKTELSIAIEAINQQKHQ